MHVCLFIVVLVCVCAGVDMVMPGDDTALTVTLNTAIPMEMNQRFTLRENNNTVGTGVVTELLE